MVNFDAIPDLLRQHKNWVMWRLENIQDKKTGETKSTKILYSYVMRDDGVAEERRAKSNDPSTWLRYDDAAATYHDNPGLYNGVGFVLSGDLGIVCIDIDDALDQNGYFRHDSVAQVFEQFDTYTEISQSGRGLHIVCKADAETLALLKRKKRVAKSVDTNAGRFEYEIYHDKRFIAITGNVVGNTADIQDCTDSVRWVYRNIIDTSNTTVRVRKLKVPETAADVIELMSRERTGKFEQLFHHGDTSEYRDDHSAADLALCRKIAFYTQDPDLIDEVFRQSALYRDKWDNQHRGDGATYGEMTIEAALANVGDGDTYLSGIQEGQKVHDIVTPLTLEEEVEGGDPVLFLYSAAHDITDVDSLNPQHHTKIRIGHRGNITTIVANPGWGKTSAFVGSIVSAVLAHRNGYRYLPLEHWYDPDTRASDTLGITVEGVGRILVVDTEQDRSDSQKIMRQACVGRHTHAENKTPDWLTWLPALDYEEPDQIYTRVIQELESAQEAKYPYDIVVVDMLADLVNNINDITEVHEFVSDLRRRIQHHNVCFVCTMHPNPKQNNDKPAGWLGTVVHRRSKTVFAVQKNIVGKKDDDFTIPSYRMSTMDGLAGKNRGDRGATVYFKWQTKEFGDGKKFSFMATYPPDKDDVYSNGASSKRILRL